MTKSSNFDLTISNSIRLSTHGCMNAKCYECPMLWSIVIATTDRHQNKMYRQPKISLTFANTAGKTHTCDCELCQSVLEFCETDLQQHSVFTSLLSSAAVVVRNWQIRPGSSDWLQGELCGRSCVRDVTQRVCYNRNNCQHSRVKMPSAAWAIFVTLAPKGVFRSPLF